MRAFLPAYASAVAPYRAALAPLFSDDRPTVAVLAANVKQAIAVPAGARFVSFSSEDGQPFWAWHGVEADALVIPSATGTVSTGEPNPTVRRIPETSTHILLVSDVATKVALSFFS